MYPLINATIEIQEMSDKLGKFGPIKKIKGKNIETGQTNTYTVYKSKQDGTDSAAWTQLQSLGVGAVVSLGYAEQPGKMPDGTSYTSRIVRNFDLDLGNGRKNYVQHNPPPQQESPRTGQNTHSSGLSQAEFSRRLGIQGHLNALLSNPNVYPASKPDIVLSAAILFEDQLEELLRPKSNIKVNSAEVQNVLNNPNPDLVDQAYDEPPIEEPPF